MKSITEVAKILGVDFKTIMSWEKKKKVPKAKRNYINWRVYSDEDIEVLKKFRFRLH